MTSIEAATTDNNNSAVSTSGNFYGENMNNEGNNDNEVYTTSASVSGDKNDIGEEDDPQTASSSQDDEEEDATSSEDVASEYSSEPIKLFVGQVPKAMEEHDLFPLFEKFGPMDDVVIIRDKQTGQHRGCAFVTFLSKGSADICEQEYHNKIVLPGGRRPLQIRPAGRKEEENKVFVGMLPRDVHEETIREIFARFGEITGVYMIRNNDGVKKGCAFIKYLSRESAMAAIETMNGDMSLEGAQRPLIVKFADTKGQKKARQNMQTRMDSAGSYVIGGPGTSSPISHASHSQANSGGNLYYMHPAGPQPMTQVYNHYSNGNMAYAPDGQYPPAGVYPTPVPGPSSANTPANFMYQQVNPYMTADGTPHHYVSAQQPIPPHMPRDRVHRPIPQRTANPKPREGPAGANLFIYHLPHDLTDADLATAFNPFGNVISAKVYVDRFTGESKGFGFVSYDSIISAEQAIEGMNGFQIGSKRLKVQHKRVNHRVPAGAPVAHMHHNNYYPQEHQQYSNHNLYPSQVAQDIPPSIEISPVQDDVETTGQTSSSQSTPQNDVDTMTQQFGALQTDERNGTYEEA